jgi:hypothetical protein
MALTARVMEAQASSIWLGICQEDDMAVIGRAVLPLGPLAKK